ncbi:hypothetical protein CAEBREN_20337 [Caenorhabditis brenneri]|uniref:Uncharacterized protein n=1 Tax=Caenorhabditis brenneri TaxID=135651 RepID=G0NYA4_CAEBE|nr:hypothetical protein CAEBREN_20337 [Caenorhabditis brenneri]
MWKQLSSTQTAAWQSLMDIGLYSASQMPPTSLSTSTQSLETKSVEELARSFLGWRKPKKNCPIEKRIFNAVRTEKVLYTRKRPEAVKYLIAKFFDNRSHVTKIGKLTISEKKILRLPINLKFDVWKLDTRNGFPMTLPAIASILNTMNLHSLGCGEIREGDLDNELMKNARTLMIRGLPEDADDYSPILVRLENPNVWFPCFGASEVNSFITAIRYWLKNGKKADTSLIVGIDDERDMEKLRNGICKEFGRFSLMMSNNLKILQICKEIQSPKAKVLGSPHKSARTLMMTAIKDSYSDKLRKSVIFLVNKKTGRIAKFAPFDKRLVFEKNYDKIQQKQNGNVTNTDNGQERGMSSEKDKKVKNLTVPVSAETVMSTNEVDL